MIVGVGQVTQRDGERDVVGLMVAAARLAAADAGVPDLLARVDEVLVPEGTWAPGDAARGVAGGIGADGARTVLARVGVLQTTPLARVAAAIASGRVDVAIVVGGEARARARSRGIADELPPGTADVVLVPDGEIVTSIEIERGLAVPVQSYALQEPAPGEVDELWERFRAVAAANAHAWDATARPAGDKMVSTPYRRRHCSRLDVDQAVALLLCSASVADELGIPVERRVHPVAVVESNCMIPVSRRADLHRSPAARVVGERIGAAAADHVELYSCFPAAVRIQAMEMGIPLDPAPTVTGGMSFAGGPLNSAALHGVAAMVERLRADPGTTGLVTAVSGMLTKQGASTWSTAPPPGGFEWVDVSSEARAATATVEVDPGYAGQAVVEASTVVHGADGPESVVVLARSRAGRRVVATGAPTDVGDAGEPVKVDGPALVS